MPNYLQGDIFAANDERNTDLAIIFGHVGLNSMGFFWRKFVETAPHFFHIRDPFTELSGQPISFTDRRWLWFFPAADNHGMPDAQFASAFKQALTWAQANGLRTIITNGIRDIDHGINSVENRRSDDRRTKFIGEIAADHERATGVDIRLSA